MRVCLCAELVLTTGLWIMLVPGVLLLVAGVFWKLVMDYGQCNIAGAESHSLIIGAAICGVGLGLAILIYTCCVWKVGGGSRRRRREGGDVDDLTDTHFVEVSAAPQMTTSHDDLSAHYATSSSAGLRSAGEGLGIKPSADVRGGGGGGGGGGGEGRGWVGREVGRRGGFVLSVPCLILNLGVTSTLVMCALCFIASFAHGVQQFEMLDAEYKRKWGVGEGPGADIPVWLGEFGKFTNEPSLWWKHLMRFLSENPKVGWAYWPLNGAKWDNVSYEWKDETYGILKMDYDTPRNPSLLSDLMATIPTYQRDVGQLTNFSALSLGGWGGCQDHLCCLQTPSNEGCADECIGD